MAILCRSLLFVALLFATVLVLIGNTDVRAQNPAVNSPTLTVVTNNYPPYVMENADNSFLPDLFDEIGAEMGVRFKFRYFPWQRGEQEVVNLDAWGTIPYRKTDEREKIYDFSDPIYLQDSHFFAYDPDGQKSEIFYDDLSDLGQYRIGGIQGYYYEPWFTAAGLNVDYAHSEEQNFKRLHLGRIDLFSTATTLGWYTIKQLFPPDEVAKFYTLEKPLIAGAGLYLMTSKDFPGNDALLTRFNTALATVKQNGTYARLVEKYGLILRY